MLSIKPGVSLLGLTPQALLAITVVHDVYEDFSYHCVLTSVAEGVHMDGSAHYAGNGVDFRTRDVSLTHKEYIRMRVQQRLGKEYDVVLSANNLHVEWHPKKGVNQ